VKRADFIQYWRRSGLKIRINRFFSIEKHYKSFVYQFHPVLAKIRINRGLLQSILSWIATNVPFVERPFSKWRRVNVLCVCLMLLCETQTVDFSKSLIYLHIVVSFTIVSRQCKSYHVKCHYRCVWQWRNWREEGDEGPGGRWQSTDLCNRMILE